MSEWKPFAYRSFYLVPFQAGGTTASGIEIQHHHGLAPIYGRVTQTHPSCTCVKTGDWIVYLPGRPKRLKTRQGSIYTLAESEVLGIVEPGDGHPWFLPPE